MEMPGAQTTAGGLQEGSHAGDEVLGMCWPVLLGLFHDLGDA
jgi:hypothetical protein